MSPLGGPETNLPPSMEPGSLYRSEIERAWRERAETAEAEVERLRADLRAIADTAVTYVSEAARTLGRMARIALMRSERVDD